MSQITNRFMNVTYNDYDIEQLKITLLCNIVSTRVLNRSYKDFNLDS